MPLVPNALERLLFLTLNQAPGPIVDLSSGAGFRVVVAGVRLRVFHGLAGGSRTVEALASEIEADPAGLRLLLGALETLGYVRQRNGLYENTPSTQKWLTPDGVIDFSDFLDYWGTLLQDYMASLEESIRSGQPPGDLYARFAERPELAARFQRGLIALGEYVLDDVTAAVALPDGARCVLDLGGGHGLYSVDLCRKHPDLKAVVIDGAEALAAGHELVAQENLAERIELRAGDFTEDAIEGEYDGILMFNIVHGFQPDDNVALLRRLREHLTPSGRVYVMDQAEGVSPLPLSLAWLRILSVTFYHLLDGQIYTSEAIEGWLREAGYSDIRRKKMPAASSVMISGTGG